MNYHELGSGKIFVSSDDTGLIVDVPAGIGSKSELLLYLSERLNFPPYFGHNWDALEECLSDLSWVPNDQLVLRHHDIPMLACGSESATYLDVLKSAIANSEKRLRVIFPQAIFS